MMGRSIEKQTRTSTSIEFVKKLTRNQGEYLGPCIYIAFNSYKLREKLQHL